MLLTHWLRNLAHSLQSRTTGRIAQKSRRRAPKRGQIQQVEILEERTLLTNVLVDIATDENDGMGVGAGTSLREAIIAANADPDASTITFDAGLDGMTIMLTITGNDDTSAAGDLDVTTDITINGNGATNTVIDAGGDSGLGDRLIDVLAGGDLKLNDVTLQNGYDNSFPGQGGGIRNDGRTTISGSTIANNFTRSYGGGLFNGSGATMAVTNSTITGNIVGFSYGGGIRNEGDLTVTNSTVSGNSAPSQGGGISDTGTSLDIEGSTISGNTSGIGGGLNSSGTGSTAVNSTFSGNMATDRGGAMYIGTAFGNPVANITLVNSTITGNSASAVGGGVYASTYYDAGTATLIPTGTGALRNSIITGNAAITAFPDVYGTFYSNDTNLIGEKGGATGIGTGLNNDLSATAAETLDTNLADNGGPTLTHALITNSPAINAGTNGDANDADSNPLTTDQRGAGFDRILDNTVDIGAFEAAPSTPIMITVTTATDENDGVGVGGVSLREAIIEVNNNAAGGTITFDASLDGTPILLTIAGADEDAAATGDLDIATEVTIQGNGAANTIIQADSANGFSDRVLEILDGADLTLDGVTITGASHTQDGGGILAQSNTNLTVRNSSISGNTGDDGGGMELGRNSTITVIDSIISGNSGDGEGGGIYANNSVMLSISGTTISNNTSRSDSGGLHFRVNGTATIDDSTISDNNGGESANRAGGIFNDGTMTIRNSQITGNGVTTGDIDGAGIFNNSDLTVIGTTISGNTGDEGGGIDNDGTLRLIDSTISNNVANSGGGLVNDFSNATIVNTTISGNIAGDGGGIRHKGNSHFLTVINSTIAGNSASEGTGGIASTDSSELVLNNSIVSGNSGGDLSGAFTGSHNVIQDGSDSGTGLTDTINADPLLSPLQDNGGPTFTHALGAGSPAIDAGINGNAVDADSNPLEFDQRGEGFARIVGGPVVGAAVDIGAFEVQPPATIIVTTEVDENDGTFDPTVGAGTSLREAIIAANLNPDVTTILFDVNLNGTPIVLTLENEGGPEDAALEGDLDITENVIIQGNGSANTIIQAGTMADRSDSVDRIFDILESTVTIEGVSLQNGSGTLGGGAVRASQSDLTITDSVLSNNEAFQSSGGAISTAQGTLTISGTTIDGNTGVIGGGVLGLGTAMTITGSTLSNNTAEFGGGGIQAEAGFDGSVNIFLTDTTFLRNSATGDDAIGGGFANGGNHAELTRVRFEENTSANQGGAVWTTAFVGGDTFTLLVDDSDFVDNSAQDGGAIFNVNDHVEVTNSRLNGNSASNRGGAIFTVFDEEFGMGGPNTLIVTGSTLTGNTAGGSGGAIYNNLDRVEIDSTTISGNTAGTEVGNASGGGIASFEGDLLVTNSTISGNTATGPSHQGGGIAMRFGGNLAVINSTISGNTGNNGGGIYLEEGNVNITNSTITQNTEGGVYNIEASLTIDNTIIAGNLDEPDLVNDDGELSGSHNLIGDGSELGSLDDSSMGDPLLGPLQDNGGPTFTHGLGSGSPAIDAGDDALAVDGDANPLLTDQRGDGFDRIVGNSVDIGAFELAGTAVLSIGDVTMNEGNTGTTIFSFPVFLEEAVSRDVTFDFATEGDSATEGIDYIAASGQGTITAGSTFTTIDIEVIGDHDVESQETFFVNLSNGDAEGLETFFSGDGRGVGTIQNDETLILNAPGQGGGPNVVVRNAATGKEQFNFLAYDPGFTGGVRLASGDINGDGIADIITAAGPTGGPHIRVFDGASGDPIGGPLGNFFAYDAGFTGGVFVASGDVNGDGFDDIVTGADAGGGPHIRVFDGQTGEQMAGAIGSFFAYGAGFTGGVRVAVGDINNDGFEDIVTGAGVGGGPHVRVFNGTDQSELASFFAYGASFTGGVYVATGHANPSEDQNADIITGPGAGGGPHVRVFSGANPNIELGNFFAFDVGFTGGVTVATTDVNNDGVSEILVAAGPGGGPNVRVFDGSDVSSELDSFFPFDIGFTGGVFVQGSPVLEPQVVEELPEFGMLSDVEVMEKESESEATAIEVEFPIVRLESLPPESLETSLLDEEFANGGVLDDSLDL